jgi:hypothetical protein
MYLVVLVLLLPTRAISEVNFSLRAGGGFSSLLNLPDKAVDDTSRFSMPLMFDIGVLVDERFGMHLEGIYLFVEGEHHNYGGVYGTLKFEFYFLKNHRKLDLYGLFGIGFGAVLLWGYEDFYISGIGTLNFGGGIEYEISDWLSVGFEPRLRLGFPNGVEVPSVELFLTTRMSF